MDSIGFFDSDGIWHSENLEGFKLWLSRHAGKRAVMKLEKWYKKRTDKENRYMHYLFDFIGKELGYSGADMKGAYKVHFKVPHTSKLDTLACETFLEDVRRHAQEF